MKKKIKLQKWNWINKMKEILKKRNKIAEVKLHK